MHQRAGVVGDQREEIAPSKAVGGPTRVRAEEAISARILGLREGREVYLCWIDGEDEIGFWHELEAGYAGRQPL